MYYLSQFCYSCLKNRKQLISINTLDTENMSFKDKFVFCLMETDNIPDEIPKYICQKCCKGINFTYQFRKIYLGKRKHLESYVRGLKQFNYCNIYTDLSVNLLNADKFLTINTDLTFEMTNKDKKSIIKCEDEEIEKNPIDEPEMNVSHEDTAKSEAEKNSSNYEIVKNKENEEKANNGEVFDVQENGSNKIKIVRKKDKALKLVLRKSFSGNNENTFGCIFCDKIFSNNLLLRKHARSHPNKSYNCKICNKLISNKSNYKIHWKRHCPTYKCNTCHKIFSSNLHLNSHKVTHLQQSNTIKNYNISTKDLRDEIDQMIREFESNERNEAQNDCDTSVASTKQTFERRQSTSLSSEALKLNINRGRPRKKPVTDQMIREFESNETQSDGDTLVTSTKQIFKRRQSTSQSSDHSEALKLKNKRGRPRKKLVTDQIIPEFDSNESQNDGDTSVASTKQTFNSWQRSEHSEALKLNHNRGRPTKKELRDEFDQMIREFESNERNEAQNDGDTSVTSTKQIKRRQSTSLSSEALKLNINSGRPRKKSDTDQMIREFESNERNDGDTAAVSKKQTFKRRQSTSLSSEALKQNINRGRPRKKSITDQMIREFESNERNEAQSDGDTAAVSTKQTFKRRQSTSLSSEALKLNIKRGRPRKKSITDQMIREFESNERNEAQNDDNTSVACTKLTIKRRKSTSLSSEALKLYNNTGRPTKKEIRDEIDQMIREFESNERNETLNDGDTSSVASTKQSTWQSSEHSALKLNDNRGRPRQKSVTDQMIREFESNETQSDGDTFIASTKQTFKQSASQSSDHSEALKLNNNTGRPREGPVIDQMIREFILNERNETQSDGDTAAASTKQIFNQRQSTSLSSEAFKLNNNRTKPITEPQSKYTDPSLTCIICAKTFKLNIQLNQHLKTNCCQNVNEINNDEVSNKKRKFQCDICNKFCTQKKYLTLHKKCHIPAKNKIRCAYCTRLFTNKCNLVRHMFIHSKERKYERAQMS